MSIKVILTEHSLSPGEVKKVYAPNSQQVIVVEDRSGIEHIIDLDMRNSNARIFFSDEISNSSVQYVKLDAQRNMECHLISSALTGLTGTTELETTTYPHYFHTETGETETPETGAVIPSWLPVYTVDDLKATARSLHEGLESLFTHLEIVKRAYSYKDVQKAEEYIVYLHRGIRAICAKGVAAVNSLSIGDRIRFCQKVLLGSADIVIDPTQDQEARLNSISAQYFALAEADRIAATDPNQIGTPEHAIVIVDPRNLTSVKLQDAIGLSGTGSHTLDGGTTITGLGLDTLTYTGDVDGTWINNLTD